MEKPQSIKSQPFCSLDEGQYQILTDPFVHNKFLNFKFSQKSSKGNIILKNHISKKDDKFKSTGQIKLWFPLWDNRALFFKSKNNEVKVQYDHGITNINQKKFNFFGSFQVQKNMNNPVIKAGFTLLNQKYNVSNRIKLSQDQSLKIQTTHKGQLQKGKWKVEIFKDINWNSLALTRNAIQLRFKQNEQNRFYIRGENFNTRNLKNVDLTNIDNYVTSFFCNFTRKINNQTRSALQVQFSKNGVVGGAIALQKNLTQRNAVLNVRAQSSKSIAFAYQGLLKNYGKFSFGAQISDLGKQNKIQYGAQIKVNL